MTCHFNITTLKNSWLATIAMFIIPTFRLMPHNNMFMSNSLVSWVHYCFLLNGYKLSFLCVSLLINVHWFFSSSFKYVSIYKKVYPINISDHVLMFTDVHGNNVSREWQFNASLLEDNELKHHLEAQWSLYLETDSEHAENPSSFWYHAKNFLRMANTARI